MLAQDTGQLPIVQRGSTVVLARQRCDQSSRCVQDTGAKARDEADGSLGDCRTRETAGALFKDRRATGSAETQGRKDACEGKDHIQPTSRAHLTTQRRAPFHTDSESGPSATGCLRSIPTPCDKAMRLRRLEHWQSDGVQGQTAYYKQDLADCWATHARSDAVHGAGHASKIALPGGSD